MKAPLTVVTVGLGFACLTVVLYLAVFVWLERSGSSAAVSVLPSVLSVAADGTVVAGCAMLWRAKQPGATQALVSAIFHGILIVFGGLWYVVGLVGGGSSAIFTLLGIANAIVDGVAVVLLGLSLWDLARSRGRRFDGTLYSVFVMTGVLILGAVANAILVTPFPIYYVTSAINVAARVVLMIVAVSLVRSAPLPAPQLAYDSAYRGPTGSIEAVVEGSMALGFLAGFFGGCIGAVLGAIASRPVRDGSSHPHLTLFNGHAGARCTLLLP